MMVGISHLRLLSQQKYKKKEKESLHIGGIAYLLIVGILLIFREWFMNPSPFLALRLILVVRWAAQYIVYGRFGLYRGCHTYCDSNL